MRSQRCSFAAFAACLSILFLMMRLTEQVDCRQRVFHPKCRGISAKRSQPFDPVIPEDGPEEGRDDTFQDSNAAESWGKRWEKLIASPNLSHKGLMVFQRGKLPRTQDSNLYDAWRRNYFYNVE